ncbi:unnamed protein product [Phyllotreta striolata]|uniref:Iron-sulfur protein NUBPL n=1 Tax=Phyllotreta striolata TaxID=444603 RepID=A0A9N9XUY4_PHYSR|nr:unnamed protein product [Phyllotreta striolata]
MIRNVRNNRIFNTKCITQYINYSSTDKPKVDLHQRREELMKRGLPKQKPIEGVKNIILICSGKGGVGKSTVSVNLATALKLANPNKEIGLLDTDCFGPSIPLMMNLRSKPYVTDDKKLAPLLNYGVKCMSAGFLVEKDAPIIWRGLRVMQGMETLIRHVSWGSIDYLIVDTPPGTGDTLLSLIQNIPINGVILVTTPQSAALEVTKKGAGIFSIVKIPIIGLVENMAYIDCPSCSTKINVYGKGTEKLAEELQCNLLGTFPLHPVISKSTDEGTPVTVTDTSSDLSKTYQDIARKVTHFIENEKSYVK